jgi:hypothetical protein
MEECETSALLDATAAGAAARGKGEAGEDWKGWVWILRTIQEEEMGPAAWDISLLLRALPINFEGCRLELRSLLEQQHVK